MAVICFADAATSRPGALLTEIRGYNPLLFDLVLKRSLAKERRRFAPLVFESRRVFL